MASGLKTVEQLRDVRGFARQHCLSQGQSGGTDGYGWGGDGRMGFWRRLGSFLALGSGSSVAIWLALPPDSAIRRTGRTAGTVVLVGADYKLLQLRKLSENPEKLAEMHTRNAKRMLNFCSQQGGMFTKFGQHVSSVDRAVPMQYKEALAMLQDKAQAHSMDSTRQTIREEMKADISDIFEEFDPVPVASASLAQVEEQCSQSKPRLRVCFDATLSLYLIIKLSSIVVPYPLFILSLPKRSTGRNSDLLTKKLP